MACEIEPVDRVAARLIIAGRVIALRGVAHIVLAVERTVFAVVIWPSSPGLRAAAQLLDLRLRRGKIAARALELEAQHDHRNQEHQRKRQQSHKKHIKRLRRGLRRLTRRPSIMIPPYRFVRLYCT